MKKKIANILFSTRLTATLFIIYAVAMAVGTILDRNMDTSPTPYTRNLIYNAWWFEAIMVVFVINFIGNIFRFRLWRKEKWATLTLHLSFILILIGAAITRYIGFEGMMNIREGATESQFLSEKTYIEGRILGDYKVNGQLMQKNILEKVDFSPRLKNSFNKTYTYGDQEVTIELEQFQTGVEMDVVPDENGESYLKIVEATDGQRHNHFLKVGEVANLHNTLFALNKPTKGAINITKNEAGLFIESPFEGEYMIMATRAQGQLVKDSIQPLNLRSRYVIGNMQLVFPKDVTKGIFKMVKTPQILKNANDGITFKISSGNETKSLDILGGQWTEFGTKKITINDMDIELRYGSKVMDLPFQIKLNDFIAERYPGTQSGYSSYESKVTILDQESGNFDYRIYMNNILDHKGYRFFQASFDPDEQGTVLSINHDRWGTYLTYAGYILLYIGLMAIMFAKNTRFDDLRQQLIKLSKKKAKMATIVLIFLSGIAQAQHSSSKGLQPSKVQIDSVLMANIAPKEVADQFGKLIIQDANGRMKPMDTYASELLRKLSKKDTYEEFTANQVALSIQESPGLWYNVPVIYLTPRKADSIRTILNIPKDQKYVSLIDFFEEDLTYKLAPYVDEATSTLVKNGFQTEVEKVHQKMNLLSNAIEGRILRIFPLPNNDNNTWISPFVFKRDSTYRQNIEDKSYVQMIDTAINGYLFTLNQSKSSGNYDTPNQILSKIKEAQKKYGGEVMLSDEKLNTEILYNKLNIFDKLSYGYLLFSFVLFVLIIYQIFKYNSKWLNLFIKIFIGIIGLLFLGHTAGLITRWYLSGHAPWSDAYESLLYVAWSVALFGLLLGRKSKLTIPATAFVASIILMVAHWNWMDPAIANLQPVLQGYWLMIHVSVIVASYGPFAIGFILGIISLLLMAFTTEKTKKRIGINIKEITIINELALTIGLVMLTIGNFLGGMWANESWGRYWGWDPKETWALISIMIYAFVVHMRLIPGLRGRWGFNLASIIAFGSILMTYFGVNFYLAGLHSYASGDQIISFQFIAAALAIISILGFFAYRGYAAHYKK